MKILVTGGAGFIGSHVVDAYLNSGHDVVVADDLSTGARDNVNPNAAFHEVDIRSSRFTELVGDERPEIVSHLAAQMDVRRSLKEPQFDADVNIKGTIRLLEACVAVKARKIIFASTGGAIYGEPAVLPATEATAPAPLCQYGVSKLTGENYIQLYQRLYGMDYTILRFANVYGPRQNPHGEAGVCAILASLILEGRAPTLYGHGDPLRDYVYVEDVARANVLALERGEDEILNLGSGVGTSVRALFDHFQEIAGTDLEPKLEPLRTGEVQDIYTSATKAASVLGWTAEVSLEDGLRRTFEYIRAQRTASSGVNRSA